MGNGEDLKVNMAVVILSTGHKLLKDIVEKQLIMKTVITIITMPPS